MKTDIYKLFFTSTEILWTFHYTTIKMIIPCKNLLNNKKKDNKTAMLKDYKKSLVERNSPQSWTWKQNGYVDCVCYCGDSWSCEQLKKQVTDKYFEKKF